MNNRILWAIHSRIGLYAGVAIAFLSITGAAALFRYEIDYLFNNKLFCFLPEEGTVSLTQVVGKVSGIHNNKTLFEIELPKKIQDHGF